MIVRLSLAFALIATSASAEPPPLSQGAHSFLHTQRGWQTAWFVCDPIGAPDLLAAGEPAGGAITLWRRDRDGGHPWGAVLGLGPGDPGAGQVYFALTDGNAAGRERGNIHGVNPGMIDPAPHLPTIGGIMLDGRATQCRQPRGATLIALTARRTVVVSEEGGRLVYRAYTPGSDKPTITLTGGVSVAAKGSMVYRFTAPGYAYRLSVGRSLGGGALTVMGAGRTIQSEPVVAYSLAR